MFFSLGKGKGKGKGQKCPKVSDIMDYLGEKYAGKAVFQLSRSCNDL